MLIVNGVPLLADNPCSIDKILPIFPNQQSNLLQSLHFSVMFYHKLLKPAKPTVLMQQKSLQATNKNEKK